MLSYFGVTFLLANLSHFSQWFWNQHEILHIFDTQVQILIKKVFRSYEHFFATLKPNSQARPENIENRFFQKCLRIFL
jgi:hypothetical protein